MTIVGGDAAAVVAAAAAVAVSAVAIVAIAASAAVVAAVAAAAAVAADHEGVVRRIRLRYADAGQPGKTCTAPVIKAVRASQDCSAGRIAEQVRLVRRAETLGVQ